jgi:hypothetical protein
MCQAPRSSFGLNRFRAEFAAMKIQTPFVAPVSLVRSEAYRAEAIVALSFDGILTPALCYSLRQAPSADERNSGYASRLQEILARLNFPEEYVASVSKCGT